MLKINLKKFFSLFLVIVLVTAQVFTAFAHGADAESSEQNVNPQVNEEVLDNAENNDELFESTEVNEETNSEKETETEAEFVGEELDEEETEETKEIEEPENPDDLIEKEEITEETNDEIQAVEDEAETETETQTESTEIETELDETEVDEEQTEESDKEVKDEDKVAEEADKEDDEEDERSDVARSAAEDEEIEVEIVDGEVIEKTEAETTETTEQEVAEAETTEAETTEEELETLEEIAETVETKLAKDPAPPTIDWTNYPNAVCDDAYMVMVHPNESEVTSVTFNGVDMPLPSDPAERIVEFTLTINPDPNGPIAMVVTNGEGSNTIMFPQKLPHDFYYVNSDPEDAYVTRTITALCHRHGGDCGYVEFTTTENVSVEWDEDGAEAFVSPTNPEYYSWQPDPLVIKFSNNKGIDPTDPTKKPTLELFDSTEQERFAIANFTITPKSGTIDPPTGLVAVETSTRSAKDGKIEGLVPYEMEWATEENQHPYITVTSEVLENLEPRTYYVRYKMNNLHDASQSAEIEVPRGTTPDPKPPSPGGGGSGGGGGGGGGGGASRGGAMPSFINIIPYAPIGADPAAGKYSLFYDAVVGAYKATPTVNTIARSPEDSAKPLETGAIDTTKESNQAEGFASGWALVQDVAGQSDNWYYFDPATKFMKTGWVQDNGYLYFTHNKDDSLRGRIYSGWHDVDGQVCYFDETNYCLTAVISKVDALTRGIVTVEDSAAAVTLGNLDLKPTVGSQGLATITFADQTSIRPGEQNANNAPTLLTVTSSTDLAESRKEFLDSLAALGMIQQ